MQPKIRLCVTPNDGCTTNCVLIDIKNKEKSFI